MASASEIKARINGISETKKITDAMYMIASAKMRKAMADLDRNAPYFEALRKKVGELILHIPLDTEDRYYRVPVRESTPHQNHGILLITSDKGLAGMYNQAAIALCEEYMSRHPRTTLFIIGEYGRQYFAKKKIPFVEDFQYSALRPQVLDARRICAKLLEYYDNEQLDEINIIYTDYVGNKPGECKKLTLLPLDRTQFIPDNPRLREMENEFVPSQREVLDGIVPSYLMGFVFSCLAESYCSEQQARMNAMKSAGDNAEEMLRTLRVQYNKLRQAAITEEMIEIAAGAKALRQKRAKTVAGEMKHDG